MAGNDLVVAGLKDHLKWMLEALETFEKGERTIRRRSLEGDVDSTSAWISEQKLQIERVKELIAAYGPKSAREI
jgi:hypothetical protein